MKNYNWRWLWNSENGSNEWLEPVSDEEYGKLQ